MRTGRIGSLEVSVVGLGCNNFGRGLDERESAKLVQTALSLGITHFDTARLYGEGHSEAYLAAGLGSHHDEVVIATKFGRVPRRPDAAGAGRADVRRSIETSLSELGRDYIDLYQLHFPDPDVPIEETLGVLSELIDEGKVREIGCANFETLDLEEAQEAAITGRSRRFASNQIHYSMIHTEPERNGLIDLCFATGTSVLPYYPLANGLLTGKVRRGEPPTGRLGTERYREFLTDHNFDLADRLSAFASERGLTPAQVALGWLLSRPAVAAVTPGATRVEHVEANVAAAAWDPTPEDLANLDEITAPG